MKNSNVNYSAISQKSLSLTLLLKSAKTYR